MGAKHKSLSPYDFKKKDKNASFYYELELNRTINMFAYKRLPETIPEVELEKILQIDGYGIVTEEKGDLVALTGGFSSEDGCDIYYRPKGIRVDNPWANINKYYEFDKDCVLIKNDPLARGLRPLLAKYATEMVEADLTLYRAFITQRAMYMATARDNRAIEAINNFYRALEDGDMVAVFSYANDFLNDENADIKTQPYSQQSNSITQIIEAYQYVKGSYNNMIGLGDHVNMKRERLTEGEAELNRDTLIPLIYSMLEERKRAFEKINEKYGTDIEVEFGGIWSKYNDKPSDISVPVDGANEGTEEDIVNEEALVEEIISETTENDTPDDADEVEETETESEVEESEDDESDGDTSDETDDEDEEKESDEDDEDNN